MPALSTACDPRLVLGDRVASHHGDPRVFPAAVSWQFWRSIQNGTSAVSRKLEETFPSACLAGAQRPARPIDSVQEVERSEPALRSACAGQGGGPGVDGLGRRLGRRDAPGAQ
jgi:hypothetical protein